MPDSVPLHHDRARADSFGSVARDYDAYRPRYPEAVIDDIATLAPAGRVLDVGSGTGIAAQQLIDRGLDVLAVEPDAAMAAVAAAKGLAVEVATFEDWKPVGRTFDLITFAQSFHWVDARMAAAKAFSLLEPGGGLVPIWHMTHPESPPKSDFDAVYARYSERLTPGTSTGEAPLPEVLTATGFEVTEKSYPVRTEYATEAWLDLVFTFSAQIILEPAAAQSLRNDLSALVGSDTVTLVGSAYVATATRPR